MKRTITIIFACMIAVAASSSNAYAVSYAEVAELSDKKPEKKKKEIKEVVFSVHLHCKNCVKKVEENIAFEKGVKDLTVSLEDQTVAVKYDASKTSEAVLKAAIEELGYHVEGVL